MPQEDKEKMPEKYETVSFDEFESIGREIVKKNLLIFLRKTCSLCMILPGGRDMKSGTGAEGAIF